MRLAMALAMLLATLVVPSTAADGAALPGRRVIGHSVQGRAIVAYHLGNPDARRVAVVLGQMHGDEPAGPRVVRALRRAAARISGVDLWVIPTMNPDGRAAHTRQNARGVDLNRNFPRRWRPLTGEYYSGPGPRSEPETRAVLRFLRDLRPTYVVSLHQPLHGVDTTDGGRVDPALRHRLARRLGLPEKPFRCWSACHGNLTGWYTDRGFGAAITVEFGAHPTRHYLTARAPRGLVRALGGHWTPTPP
jgi:murein peptide amidase A